MKLTFDKALTLFKKLAKDAPTRSYAQTFLVTSSNEVIYSDGFILVKLDCKHSFSPGVYSFTGQPSSVKYPDVQRFMMDSVKDATLTKEVSSLLQVARLVKPASRKLVIVSDEGQLDGDSGINLKYLSYLPQLGITHITKYGDLYHAIAPDSFTSVYIASCKKD